ncbi:MAG: esterase/lipase [Microbacterium sp.]|jgi:acetyl esterase/lipase|nr:esterase/lipase [Microbacterium sp.]
MSEVQTPSIVTQKDSDAGADVAAGLIAAFEQNGAPAEMRLDVDTASLQGRFPALAAVRVRDLDLGGARGPVAARLYVPPHPSGPSLVWVHGGAFIGGDLDMPESNWVGLELASRGIPVLAIDYRKALNGVHHPLPLDDVQVAWTAAVHSEVWGYSPTAVHLGGASAGACLATSAALREAAEKGTRPASVVAVYPLMHRALPSISSELAALTAALPDHLRFPPGMVRVLNENYVGESEPLAHPIAFPADGVLPDLPRMLIVHAEADTLRASGEAFSEALRRAGGKVDESIALGTVHGYLDVPGDGAALETLDRVRDWILG